MVCLLDVMNSKPCSMRLLYNKEMSGLMQVFFVADHLLKRYVPKVHKHFEKEHVHISMFAPQWLGTVYTNSFPFDLVTRVWDIFLVEGWKIVYRVMLAILRNFEKKLLGMNFEEIMKFLRLLPQMIDGSEIIKNALKIRLSNKRISALDRKFKQEQK
mmetsp:Transcript_20211/g.45813  ORF Transcript_20211/g.45813 Transcript_20211/m.45813 type:complete len:157 (+) Transcript_20211:2172-2642(+)